MSFTPSTGDALLVIDVQRDFLAGGALPVPAGDEIIDPINRAIGVFRARGLPVFASRDWHPLAHGSFQPQGGAWPVHCVAGTEGAAFAPGLDLPPDAEIVSKATAPSVEAFSAFAGTDLLKRLRAAGVRRLVVAGLATEYCVMETAMDALVRGFAVVVLADAVRPLHRNGGGSEALLRLREAGATFARSEDLGA